MHGAGLRPIAGPAHDEDGSRRHRALVTISEPGRSQGVRRPRTGVGKAGGLYALEVRDAVRRHCVPLAGVDWVEADGNHVELG